jgi:hypothetical protein
LAGSRHSAAGAALAARFAGTNVEAVTGDATALPYPGGTLIGSDSLASNRLHRHHEGVTYNPVEPAAFLTRLQTLGFGKITIGVDHALTFVAHKPA